MIDNDRVHEEFKLAIMDQKFEKDLENATRYFKNDYILKELIISFFTGTICYGLLFLLFLMAQMEALSGSISAMNYSVLVICIIFSYVIFISVYLFVTGKIYANRYKNMEKRAKAYGARLKKLSRMYEKEDQ